MVARRVSLQFNISAWRVTHVGLANTTCPPDTSRVAQAFWAAKLSTGGTCFQIYFIITSRWIMPLTSQGARFLGGKTWGDVWDVEGLTWKLTQAWTLAPVVVKALNHSSRDVLKSNMYLRQPWRHPRRSALPGRRSFSERTLQELMMGCCKRMCWLLSDEGIGVSFDWSPLNCTSTNSRSILRLLGMEACVLPRSHSSYK